MSDIGVLQQERERQQFWSDLELPDPVRVLSEERATELKTGEAFTSPKRGALDAFFAANGDDKKPNTW